MPDNINIKDSANAVVPVATEDIGGGVEVQRVKLMLGAHGQDGGDVTGPNPLPVEVQNTTDTDNPVWGNQGPLTLSHERYVPRPCFGPGPPGKPFHQEIAGRRCAGRG
jgi:hypothetical protein